MSSIININHNNHNQNATARKGSLMTMLTQSQKRKSTMKLFSILMVAILMFSPGGLLAGSLPSGYKVVKGKVTVTVDGKVMDIDQATQKAIVNWQKFGIDEGYTVNVNQINSAAAMLARVVGNDPSNILGNLNATGHFYLVNQNGVYFGPNARVDVGAIIASTMDILDDDFMAGNLNFFGEAKGNVVNAGKINADAVALIGQNVQNTGTINASQVGLVAAQKAVTLSDFGGGSSSDFRRAFAACRLRRSASFTTASRQPPQNDEDAIGSTMHSLTESTVISRRFPDGATRRTSGCSPDSRRASTPGKSFAATRASNSEHLSAEPQKR